jgi:hypothetical protein
MPLAYVLDEHLRGALWRAISQWNARGIDPVDVVRVGDPPDLPLGTLDPDLLAWAEHAGRILVSRDRNTLVAHLGDHLRAGARSPGIFLIRPGGTLSQVLAMLVLAALSSDPADWRDAVTYIP